MPAAIAVPIITAAAPAIFQGTAALLGARSNAAASRRATDAQTAASDKAMAYEQEKESQKRAAYERAMEIYQNNYKTWLDKYGDAGLKRYGYPSGISLPGSGKAKPDLGIRPGNTGYDSNYVVPGSTLGTMVPAPTTGPAEAAGMQAPAQGQTLGTMAQAPPGPPGAPPNAPPPLIAPISQQPGGTLAGLAAWSDWNRRGNNGLS